MRLFKKKLNVRLLAILLVSALLGGAAIHGLHEFQVWRQAGFFLEQARQARKEKRFPQALNHFDQYLRLRPDDVEALEEFGLLEADVGSYARAYLTLEKLLRLPPDPRTDRRKARRRLVDVAMRIGRFSDAAEHLEDYLLKEAGDDDERVELLELLTQCQMYMGDYKAAAQLMDQMVEDYPDSAPALVFRAKYFYRLAMEEADPTKQQTMVEKAKRDAETALGLNPENVDAHGLAALCYLQTKEFEIAREHAGRGVALAPERQAVHLLLVEVERSSGRLDEAIAAAQWGLERIPGSPDLLWTLANLSLNPRDLEQAREATDKLADARLADLGVSEKRVQYLRAGIVFWEAWNAGSQADWSAVRQKMDNVRDGLQQWPELIGQVDYWLGECYGRLGRPDRQMDYYRTALRARPSWTSPRIALAGVLSATGKTDDALKEYERLEQARNMPASVLLRAANLLVQRNRRVRQADRDFSRVDRVLDRVEEVDPDSVDVAILRAESLLQQGRIADARLRLDAARDKHPREVRLWIALAALADAEQAATGKPDAPDTPNRAAQMLDEAQGELGDQVPLRIARARRLVRQLRVEVSEESKQALQQLAGDVDHFSDADKGLLWQGLMEAWVLVDQMEEAKRFGRLISELQPENLLIRLTLLELIRRTASDDVSEQALQDVERIAAEIDKIEGSGARWHYAEAVRLRLTADQTPDQDEAKAALNEALEHLNVTEESLPRWASVALLAGEIHDLLGQPDDTLEQYSKAIQLGSRDLTILKRTIQLLNQKRRYANVDQLLRLMGVVAQERGAEFPMGLGQQQAESFLRAGEFDRALEEARNVAADSDDSNDHFWLAQMLITVARPEPTREPSEKNKERLEEAERSLRRAIKLAPEEYRPWGVLVQLLKDTGQIQEVEETLQEARQAVRDPGALILLLKGIHNWDEVVKIYEAKLANDSHDSDTTLALIDSYVKAGTPDRAEPFLRKILAGKIEVEPTTTLPVRRLLAQILIRRGGNKNLDEAAGLIRENLDVDAPSTPDKRSLAHVLAMAPEYDKRAEAIGLLERLKKGEATPADQFLLATLYSTTQGNWPQSRSRMIALLASHGDQPQYVASYVAALLDRKELSDAELWLRKLDKLSPNSLAARGLRARMFVERKQFDAAVAHLIDPLTEPGLDSSQRERLLPVIASQLEQLAHRARENDQQAGAEKLAAKAEALHREYVETAPEEFLRLASFLGRQNRPLEALELVEKASAPTGGSPRELLILADFHIALERFDEVEALYRKVLRNNPDDVIALNNLAVLLALKEKQLDEALRFINRAIELTGAGPIMLDSRATVYLARKELPEALANMQDALKDPHTPTRLFHLAQIKDRMHDKAGARQALEAAHELNLKADQLHPLERPVYDKLNKKLNSDG